MNRWTAYLCAIACCLWAAGTAQAQDISELQQLLSADVVKTASQSLETTEVAPATAVNITAEQLRRYGIHTLEEAVNFLAMGVSSSGRVSHGRPAELGARGIAVPEDNGSHILLMLNGHHLNEPGEGVARFDRLAGIPLEIVDHIEVVIGPGAVLYGNNAMLGVIHVITLRGAELKKVRTWLEGGYPLSARVGAAAGDQLSMFGEKTDALISLEHFSQQGPELTVPLRPLGTDVLTGEPIASGLPGEYASLWGGTLRNTAYSRASNALLRLSLGEFNLTAHGRITAMGDMEGILFDNPHNLRAEHAVGLDLSYATLLSSVTDLTVRLYADGFGERRQQRYDFQFICQATQECDIQLNRTSRWLGSEVRTKFDWLRNGDLVTLVGADGRIRDLRRASHRLGIETGEPVASSYAVLDKRDAVFGAYLQQVLRPFSPLALNAGARLDYDRRFAPVVSPRLAATAELWAGATTRAVYASAFRAPGRLEEIPPDGWFLPSDLDAERVNMVELSMEQKLGPHRVLFGGFWSRWTDMIGDVVLTEAERVELLGPIGADYPYAIPLAQRRNISTMRSVGVNLLYEGSAINGDLRFGFSTTLTRARQQESGDDTERQPPTAPTLVANARLAYALPAGLPELSLTGHYLSRRPADQAYSENFRDAPYAPPQLELRAAVTGQVGSSGFRYRLIGNYAFADRGPYVFGRYIWSGSQEAEAQLNPIYRYQVFLELGYDFAL